MASDDRSPENRNRDRRDRREDARRRVHKRRRLVALGGLVVFLVLVIWMISSCGSDQPKSEPGPTAAEIKAAEEAEKARVRAREDRAIQNTLAYTTFISKGGGKRRQVALTFDDGPGPSTPAILEVLRKTKTPATFFTTGVGASENKQVLRDVAEQGHAIGNHTLEHPDMSTLDAVAQENQISSQEEIVSGAGVEQYKLFRPPYRAFNQSTFDLLAERGNLMVLWDVDSNDYAGPDPAVMADQVLNDVKPGSIVLMHDGPADRTVTLTALPKIIKGLRKQKLRPVTLPRLLITDPPPRTVDKYPEGL